MGFRARGKSWGECKRKTLAVYGVERITQWSEGLKGRIKVYKVNEGETHFRLNRNLRCYLFEIFILFIVQSGVPQ